MTEQRADILLVEDNPADVKITQRALRDGGTHRDDRAGLAGAGEQVLAHGLGVQQDRRAGFQRDRVEERRYLVGSQAGRPSALCSLAQCPRWCATAPCRWRSRRRGGAPSWRRTCAADSRTASGPSGAS